MNRNIVKKSSLLVALLTGAVFAFAATAQAGQGDKLIRLSHELEGISGELRHEFQLHYSHTSAYRHLIAYAARIESEADHIHSLSHNPHTSSIHILTDLKELDQVSSQLHNIVDMADGGRYGRVHGNTQHVHEQLGYLTRVIHAMEVEIMMIRRAAPRVLPQVLPQTGLLSNVPCDAPNPYLQNQQPRRQPSYSQHQHQRAQQQQQQTNQHLQMKRIGQWLGQGGRNTTYVPPQRVAPQNGSSGFSLGGRTFWFRR